ncbi:MAG: hypothetical protein GWN62_06490, partial [Aliifodinibius sp.]|nr:hypothetical protein [Nitrosopumilaceae archaeon]NIV10938.1 hypothetical protein [Fodinibius sp.]NIX61675.1 hypothetical protein [Nitrosopumilaceae archaeon]
MKDELKEIRQYLQESRFTNEEQVRISIVLRILKIVGWDIWNPNEVKAEFNPVPTEDSTRVDFALFLNSYYPPTVFIEVKSVGRIESELTKIEQQLRDYNRNNTAQFSVITDGQQWRFYYSQTGGEFSQKCFKIVDIITDEFDDIITVINKFLSKTEIL